LASLLTAGFVGACGSGFEDSDDGAEDKGEGASGPGGEGPTTGGSAGSSQGGSAGSDQGGGGTGDVGPGGAGAGAGGSAGGGTCEAPFVCDGAELQRCTDGDLVLEEECATEALCNADDGQCDEPECEPDDYRCVVETLQVCNVDQTDFEDADTCASAALCDAGNGQCDEPACDAMEFQCTGSMLQRCNADLTDFEDVLDCVTAPQCDAVAGECEVTCTPNAYQCNGATLLQCNSTGSTLGIEELCQTPELCDEMAGQCDMPACAMGQHRCTGTTLEVCNAGRTDYEDEEECATAALCNPTGGTCTTPACVADAYACESNVLRRCKTDRTGFDVVDACSDATEICQTEPPLCLGPAIIPGTDNWEHRTDNSFGVQGAWYTTSGMGSSFSSFTSSAGGVICAFGTAAQVVGGDYAAYWGAGIGGNLCQESDTDPNPLTQHTLSTCPWGSLDRVEGIRFRVTGDNIPTTLQLVFVEEGRATSAYVAIATGAGRYTALIADAGFPPPSNPAVAANVRSLLFQVPGSPNNAQQFGFCVSELEVIGSLN
jgi:hypothetical protein